MITMNYADGHPVWMLPQSFAHFRRRHQTPLLRMWIVSVTLSAMFLSLQPRWQSDVVAGLLTFAAAAFTGLLFAMTASGLTTLRAVLGEGILSDALLHTVEAARTWRMAGHLQPAWH